MIARCGFRAGAAARSYATLREIETRLKSIKNIEKITNTMMVVASTRVGKAQRAMQSTRVYGDGTKKVFEESEAKAPEDAKKNLLVVMSSDKGLCGSIHSQLARAARKYIAKNPDTDIVIVGDKSKAQISRSFPEKIKLSFSGIGKESPTFAEAAIVADAIEGLEEKYDGITLLYNRYITSVSFEPTFAEVFSEESLEAAPKYSTFELEAEDATANFSEFSLANSILFGLAEGHAAEISARRNAMDNASKNANDMIGRYSILYNRTRQAVITNELVDIITGASSLE